MLCHASTEPQRSSFVRLSFLGQSLVVVVLEASGWYHQPGYSYTSGSCIRQASCTDQCILHFSRTSHFLISEMLHLWHPRDRGSETWGRTRGGPTGRDVREGAREGGSWNRDAGFASSEDGDSMIVMSRGLGIVKGGEDRMLRCDRRIRT